MTKINFLSFCLVLAVSCTNNRKDTHTSSIDQSILSSDVNSPDSVLARIKKNTIYFEGKFERIEKIGTKKYKYYLRDQNDSIQVFTSSMYFTGPELKALKDSPVNFTLNYKQILDPSTNKTENEIQTLSLIQKGTPTVSAPK